MNFREMLIKHLYESVGINFQISYIEESNILSKIIKNVTILHKQHKKLANVYSGCSRCNSNQYLIITHVLIKYSLIVNK